MLRAESPAMAGYPRASAANHGSSFRSFRWNEGAGPRRMRIHFVSDPILVQPKNGFKPETTPGYLACRVMNAGAPGL